MERNTIKTLAACAAMASALSAAAMHDWENPAVNSRNRMPAATYAMPLADEKAALSDALEFDTPWKTSLNGEWKFRWTGDPARRPFHFWECDYDVSGWETIDVPSCVELRGYGMPHYLAHGYPHKFAWPRIFDRETGRPDYNPVLSYRRKFAVPDAWKGRETILHFEGVASAFYVWINGREVGYAEDSKLPSEFNITEFMKDGDNDIAVQVFRWCDGSYVEDQDMLRFSGIFRDVALWSRPKTGIADFAVSQTFAADYTTAEVKVDVSTYGAAKEVAVALYDAQFKEVANGKTKTAVSNSQLSTLNFQLSSPILWSAEKPYLYTLVLKCGEDIRAKRIGLKEQKIVGDVFYVNGRPVKFKGVNRHETSPDNGRAVTLDEMVRDITLMKRYNIDTVRTCHYPDRRLWYDLCDRYGIYLVAEANVEAHGAGYGKDGFGPVKEWEHAIVERNERQLLFYRNNPSVTIWSMGNETKHGDNFRAAIAAVRKIDPSRPIHWERGAADADMDAAMYKSVEQVNNIGAKHDAARDRPFFHTEYAHAMGNAIGNFQEYWDVTYAHPSLIGGCIWDWKDQAIWAGTGRIDPKTGREERYFAYGGDFYDNPHNGPICQNGIVGPLAEVTPKLIEVGHVHRNLVVERGTGFRLWNRFLFTWADEFEGRWQLLEDGMEVAYGRIAPAHIAPLSCGDVTLEGLDAALAEDSNGKERFVNVSFATKSDTPWAKKGWVVARDQIALGGTSFRSSAAGEFSRVERVGGRAVAPRPPLVVKEDSSAITVERGGTVAVFSRKSGLLTRLSVKGVVVLEEVSPGVPAGPHLTCVRAFVDNDKWLKESFLASGLVRLGYHPEPIVVEGDTVKTVIDVTGTKGCGFKHECTYRFNPDGSIEMDNKVTPYGRMPKALPRLGLTMRLVPALEHIKYYGRGPWENYVDRCTGSFVGIYESTVTEQYVDYVRPQDNGGKSGVRWAEFTDGAGKGVRFSASEPMFMQALHFGWEDLFLSRHDGWQKDTLQVRRYAPPVAQSDVILNLDVRQTGLGGASVGPEPMEKYRFDPSQTVAWRMVISPVAHSAAMPTMVPVVVLPDKPTAVEESAASELAGELGKCLGETPEIRGESELSTLNSQLSTLYVGATKAAKKARAAADGTGCRPYQVDEVFLKSVVNGVVLGGDPKRAPIYAVDLYLEKYCGVRWWTSDAATYPKLSAAPMKDIALEYAPQFKYRETYYLDGFDPFFKVRSKGNFTSQTRYLLSELKFVPPEMGGNHRLYFFEGRRSAYHSFFEILPPKVYFEKHPEWYSLVKGKREAKQLCLANDEMKAEYIKGTLRRLREDSTVDFIQVSQNDWQGFCECEKCKAMMDEDGGAPSGPYLRFANDVAEAVEREFPNVRIDTFAYQFTRRAPTRTRPRSNVVVRLCDIECDFARPLADASAAKNVAFAKDLADWRRVAGGNLFIWDYLANFRSYMMPHPNIGSIAPNIRLFADNGVVGVFEQGDALCNAGSFAALRHYVVSHLLWDPADDGDRLVDEFLAGYYGTSAAPILKKFIAVVENGPRKTVQAVTCYHKGAPFLTGDDKLEAARLMDEAVAEAERDGEPFASRVRRERLSVDHMVILSYDALKSLAAKKGVAWTRPATRAEAVEKWIADVNALGVRAVHETPRAGDLWKHFKTLRKSSQERKKK